MIDRNSRTDAQVKKIMFDDNPASTQTTPFMQRALALAAERRGFCAPNPAVGAVVVRDGQIVGEGTHWACGEPHAEVMAIRQAGIAARGADIYVTLEPCCHQGRTPPCTDLLIQAGVKQVFYGQPDPNPQVAGRGAAQLQAAGIACELQQSHEVTQFYQSYRYWWQYRQPWVTAKLALSLDGKIAAGDGKPVAITGAACQQLTFQWRRCSDAILTTANTVLADNPQLNVRLADTPIIKKPIYILDRRLQLPTNIQLLDTSQRLTILHQADVPRQRVDAWQALGVRCVEVPVDASSHELDWQAILRSIGADGVHDLWIEAGGRCFQSLVQRQLAQRIVLYLAPKILGPDAMPAFTRALSLLPPHFELHWQYLAPDVVLIAQLEQN